MSKKEHAESHSKPTNDLSSDHQNTVDIDTSTETNETEALHEPLSSSENLSESPYEAASDYEEKINALEEQLRSQEDAFQALKDENLRMISEMRNESQRNREYTEREVKHANQGFIQKLIPVLDAMDAGLSQSQDTEHVLFKGLEMTQQTLLDILIKNGIETIDPDAGTPFDPDTHEAIGMQTSDAYPEQSVLNVLQKGYKLHDRTIRAAKVMICSG